MFFGLWVGDLVSEAAKNIVWLLGQVVNVLVKPAGRGSYGCMWVDRGCTTVVSVLSVRLYYQIRAIKLGL